MTVLSEKTRIALGLKMDHMPMRMAVLQAIADNGPLRKCDIQKIAGCTDARASVEWLLEQSWVSRTEGSSHMVLFSVTTSGLMRLREGQGDLTPPPTRTWEPYRPTKDERWGYVPPERLKAFEAPSAGWPT